MRSTISSIGRKDLVNCLSTLCPVLESYALQRFGGAVETAGWQDFSRWGAGAIAYEKDSYQSAFTAWWLFAWLPDDHNIQGEQFLTAAPDHAIAADYLTFHRANISSVQQKVIERALTSPYSYYTVLLIESGNRLQLQEIYTQKRVTVEVGSSTAYVAGDVLFSAVLSVDGVSILLGCMPQALTANSQAKIETHRNKWRAEAGKAIDERLLYLHDTELRRYYFMLLKQKQQANLH